MLIKIIKAQCVLIGIGIIISSCTPSRSNIAKTYSGPDLKREEIAVLWTYGDEKVVSIDGRKFGLLEFNHIFELKPGPHTVEFVLRGGNHFSTDSITISFNAKPNFDYYSSSFVFFTDGNQFYSLLYEKISNETYNYKKASECREKLSINWQPRWENRRWFPYLKEYGPRIQISANVIDWEHKGRAKYLNSTHEDFFTKTTDSIILQQTRAMECIGQNAKKYFEGIPIYDFLQ